MVLCTTGALAAGVPGAGADPGTGTVSGMVTRPNGAAIVSGTASVLFCPQPIPASNASFCTFFGGVLVPVAADGSYSTPVPIGTWYAAAIVGTVQSAAVGPFAVLDGASTVQNFSVSYADVTGTVRDTAWYAALESDAAILPGDAAVVRDPEAGNHQPDGDVCPQGRRARDVERTRAGAGRRDRR